MTDRYQYHLDSDNIPDSPDIVWVFGSNLKGIHGAGAALVALDLFGAKMHKGRGFEDRSYAIPTKSTPYCVLPLLDIDQHVRDFVRFALANPTKIFWVTRIGCGLAGYTNAQIAPMFKEAPVNCNFALPWKEFLE